MRCITITIQRWFKGQKDQGSNSIKHSGMQQNQWLYKDRNRRTEDLQHAQFPVVKCQMVNNCTISVSTCYTKCVANVGLVSVIIHCNTFGRGLLPVSVKDSGGLAYKQTLRQTNGNFPLAISTAFIPAWTSYFLSYSTHFLFCHSYRSLNTIVPFLLKRDIVES